MNSSIHVKTHGSSAFQCAVAETQGLRDCFEDAHAVAFTEQSADMWLLDGHHGSAAARFGAPALAKELGPAIKGDTLPSRERISQSFRAVDNQLRKEFKKHPDDAKAGSTVIGLLAAKQSDGNYSAKLINCGDSRGVIIKGPTEKDYQNSRSSSKDSPKLRSPSKMSPSSRSSSKDSPLSEKLSEAHRRMSVIMESIDHKPCHPEEKVRIEAAGGRVSGDRHARIDGKLAVSRGLGDFAFKNDRKLSPSAQKVSCIPDVYEIADLQAGTIVVLACDGLWDVMTSKEVASLVSSRIHGEPQAELADIARDLVTASLKRKSHDNITVLLAQLSSAGDHNVSDSSTCCSISDQTAQFISENAGILW